MGAFFIKLLNISITASWVVLAVVAFRLILKKAPKFIMVLMWALVAIRLVLPISVESAFSLIPDTAPVDIVYKGGDSVVEESDFSKANVTSYAESADTVSMSDALEHNTSYLPQVESDAPPHDSSQVYEESAGRFEPESYEVSDESMQESESTESKEDSTTRDYGIGGTVDDNTPPTPPTDTTNPHGLTKANGGDKGFWKNVISVISVVWITGVILMLVYIIISYTRVRHTVREAIPLKDGVWICDNAPTSFILGIIKPGIYLPASVSAEDVIYVLAHEEAHIKRGDYLWKPIGFLLLAVYWFNPLMWLAYILFSRDIEYATDEKALGSLGIECKKPYSMALINCSTQKRLVTACPLAFGGMDMTRRIKSVLNYKKPAIWVIIVAAVACLAILLGFMTNPNTKDPNDIISSETESNYVADITESQSDESSNTTELTDLENDKALTDAIIGTWYGIEKEDEGTYYTLSSGGNGEVSAGSIVLGFNWVINDGNLTFMYHVGGEYTVTEVRCENGIFSFIDKAGKHRFSQTEPEEKENISWSLSEDGTLTISGKGKLWKHWDGREAEIKKVIIGEGITSISVSAFRDNINLESVILPDSLVAIDSNAFLGCTALYSIELPDKLCQLDSGAFYDTGIYNTESNWENGGLYVDGCLVSAKATEGFSIAEGTVLIAKLAVKGHIEHLVLPDSVKRVCSLAFDSVGSVHIPANMEYIGNGSFNNVHTFTVDKGNPYFSAVDGHLCDKEGKLLYTYAHNGEMSVVIPEGIKYIAERALDTVYFDISLYLPTSLEIFNTAAFEYSHICDVEVAEDNAHYISSNGVLYTKDGKTLVYYPYAKSRDSYNVNNGVEHIGDRAFYSCGTIKELILPNSIKTVGTCSFSFCENLESINLPEGIREIKAYAFSDCYKLKSVVLPDSLVTLGKGAFHSAGLTEVKTGAGLVTIGSHAFYGTKLKEIYFGSEVRSIGDMALYGSMLETIKLAEDNKFFTVVDGVLFDKDCKTLLRYPPALNRNTYTLPDSVESISVYAFANCYKLKIIALNDGLTRVGNNAFSSCAQLMHIIVPQSVETINNGHFEGCSSLDTVYYGGSEEMWAKIAQGTNYSYFSQARVVFNAKLGPVDDEFKELRVFVPTDHYLGYAQTKDVFYDGTTDGLMAALIKYCSAAEDSKINSFEIKDNVAHIDVNKAFVKGIIADTAQQHYGIGSLVNTVIYNLGVEKVMLSCDGGTLSLPDTGAFTKPVGFLSGWLVYSMVEGERPTNALIGPEEQKAMRLMSVFLKALSDDNYELCNRLFKYDLTENKYGFIETFNPYTTDTIILPDELKFSYYFDQSRIKEGQVAFSTVASDGDLSFELVIVLGYDDIAIEIVDAGYESIH